MSQYNATREEIMKFIWSDKCYVSVPRDKALVFISDSSNQTVIREKDMRHIKTESDALSVDDTPGGITVKNLLQSNKLTNADRVSLHSQVEGKFISRAQGNMSVIFAENATADNFKRWHLPQIVSNKEITSLNHIEKRLIDKEYELDNSHNKIESKDRITIVAQGKEDIAYLIGKKPLDPASERKVAIEQAISQLGGEKLHTAFEKHVSDMNRLNRANYRNEIFNKRKELMKGLPFKQVFMKVEEYKLYKAYKEAVRAERSSDRAVEQLRTTLNSKPNLEKIFNSANEILSAKRNGMKISPEGMDKKVTKEVNRYVDMRKPSPVHADAFIYGNTKWGTQTPDQQVKKGRKL